MAAAGPDPDEPERIGKRAFNKTKSFFDDQKMIFQKIDGDDDIGIDAVLTLVRRGPDAGRSVNVQVKGGRAYKRATHVEKLFKRRGMTCLRLVDPMLWPCNQPARGCEGHHWVGVTARLATVWHNARPTYVIVQDPDDDELYFGNLTRMVDMQPLDQDLAGMYEEMQKPNDGSRHHAHLARVHSRIARLTPDERDKHETWMPLYPDLRLTPDGLGRFLRYAPVDARQPKPERQFGASQIKVNMRYPDGTLGPSLETLEDLELEALGAEKWRLNQELRRSRLLKLAPRGGGAGAVTGRAVHPHPGYGVCTNRDVGAAVPCQHARERACTGRGLCSNPRGQSWVWSTQRARASMLTPVLSQFCQKLANSAKR